MSNYQFPWYDIVNDGSLAQGDIITQCPVLQQVSAKGLESVELDVSQPVIEAERVITDMIIMTQSCDLEQEKVDTVVLCPVCAVTQFVYQDDYLSELTRKAAQKYEVDFPRLNSDDFNQKMNYLIDKNKPIKNQLEKIRKGECHAYHLINECQTLRMPFSVVDFHRLYTLPKNVLRDIARARGTRARLLPPYREHLAQSFARYFMRVGLPIDIPPFAD